MLVMCCMLCVARWGGRKENLRKTEKLPSQLIETLLVAGIQANDAMKFMDFHENSDLENSKLSGNDQNISCILKQIQTTFSGERKTDFVLIKTFHLFASKAFCSEYLSKTLNFLRRKFIHLWRFLIWKMLDGNWKWCGWKDMIEIWNTEGA